MRISSASNPIIFAASYILALLSLFSNPERLPRNRGLRSFSSSLYHLAVPEMVGFFSGYITHDSLRGTPWSSLYHISQGVHPDSSSGGIALIITAPLS